MLLNLSYRSRKYESFLMNAIVRYDNLRLYKDKYIMLEVIDIYECTDPYLEKMCIGDSFICNFKDDIIDNKIELSIYEWESNKDKKHFYFDIYHNYDIEIPNTVLF